MDSFTLFLILFAVCSGILSCVYLTLLVHVVRGNKNKWLLANVLMLLAVNVANLIALYPNYELYFKDSASTTVVWLYTETWVVTDFGLCVSHYLLAMKYQQLSKNIPALIDKQPEVPYSVCNKVTFWTLLALNACVPLFETYTLSVSTTD